MGNGRVRGRSDVDATFCVAFESECRESINIELEMREVIYRNEAKGSMKHFCSFPIYI